MKSLSGPIIVSFDAIAREKSICYNSAHVCFNLDQIWTMPIGSKYDPVHDVIGPRPLSRDQEQKKMHFN